MNEKEKNTNNFYFTTAKTLCVFGILILQVSVFVAGCRPTKYSKSFDREKEVFEYLSKRNLVKNTEPHLVFIFNNYSCNGCFIDLFDDALVYFKNNQKEKLFILALKDSLMETHIKKLKNFTIIYDSAKMLDRYGLSYNANLLFKIKNSNITEWTEFNTFSIQKIKKIAQ